MVERGDVGGEHLFMTARKMPFREVEGVRKLYHLSEEVGPGSEAFDDSGQLVSSRTGPPEVVGRSGVAGGFVIFNNLDLGGWFHGFHKRRSLLKPAASLGCIQSISLIPMAPGAAAPPSAASWAFCHSCSGIS